MESEDATTAKDNLAHIGLINALIHTTRILMTFNGYELRTEQCRAYEVVD